jgi:hypothetical protein
VEVITVNGQRKNLDKEENIQAEPGWFSEPKVLKDKAVSKTDTWWESEWIRMILELSLGNSIDGGE